MTISDIGVDPDLWAHACISESLASNLRQRGDVIAEQSRAHSEAWMQNIGTGITVTERKEEARMAANSFAMELARLDGEIEAERVELHHLELKLSFTRQRE